MSPLVFLVFCCYQQVYDLFNMSCLWVILQLRGRDGMSTPRNGGCILSLTYHAFAEVVSRCLPCTFHLPECPFSYGTGSRS